jgi:hypothetical protein
MLGGGGQQAGLDAPLPSQPPPPVAVAPQAPLAPLAPAPAPAPAQISRSTPPIAPIAPVIVSPSVPPPPGPTPSTLRADVAANVPSQIVFKREQDATEAMPLTYREYIYGVPPGTTEAACETLLMTQLEFVRASLERAAAGKLVNLAVVDAPFDPKARTAPLATLNWKDWRGAPVVGFPRRPGYVPASSAAPQPAPSSAPPAVVQAGQFAAVPAAWPAPVPAVFQPVVQVPAAPAFTPPPAPAFVAPPPPPPPPPAAATPQVVASPRAVAARVRGEDLVADLFEAMHDLHFLRDAIEGGEFCLTLAMEKLPYGAGIVHLYDIDRREFLITSTRGLAAEKLLLLRHPEDEPILSEAMRKRRSLVISDAAHSHAAAIGRYVTLGGVQSLIVAPVMQSGRFLGAIELLNPIDGQPFTEAEGNAVMYIADQLAEFVGARGVVTDPERIAARKSPGA